MYSRDEILQLIRDKVHHPASARELAQVLRVPREERVSFKRQLKALVGEGVLLQIRGNRFGLAEKMDLVVGRLQTNPGGFGFVVPEHLASQRTDRGARADIYIAAGNLMEAMHGDRVVARIERQTPRGPEGRIIRILQRSSETVVGRFELDSAGLGYVVPFDRRVLTDIHVPSGQWSSAEPGDMVVVEITRWPTATRGPIGHVVEVLGRIDEPGVDTQIVIRKHHIPDAHGEEAVEEARRLGGAVRERDIRGRTDFRRVTTVTIDGEHARDFDDAVTIERLPNGRYWLGVHIADVSQYVREGSALDEEAYERGTSVYFPERAVHMFPAELATGLCSLNPHVDRLVQSCLMEVDGRGTVVRYEIHEGVINSDARMTYTDVNAILTGRDPDTMARHVELVPMFERMRELFEILLARRRRRGSIDFDLPETEVVLSELGEIEAIIPSERNVAHRLIEEFMLLANETVAAHLVSHGVPALHRVHEPPDPKKVEDFEAFITTLGYTLAAHGHALRPTHFQKLIDRMRGTPEERPIAALMLRTMQKAKYDAAPHGHFGLAAEHYTHFTSPIRRYPDLVVHRMLRESRSGAIAEARREELEEDLPEVARYTSEMERRADEAERELLQWKKVRFMADKVGDEYHGYVTGVAPFGLFVELVEHFVEGLVHISSMADDYYRYVEQQHMLRGENTKRVYRLGDRVLVQVVRVDMERRQVDLGLVEILEAVRREARALPTRSKVAPKRERRRAERPGRRERAARTKGGRRG
ncbi:MAG: ribonuclease R [Acidobacteria bacterium RIFCSPLOWO2_02_FULL_68_18]|nr:MAG: ribonuclease R [Acidobacteria bacterium RIFCSPLOWO2_02_FULL_68_18]OFW49422.1 MAG: ribonuclease R [Acidobacteria bacterium RIFCSPLOWO2_12_FULL_68_19]